MDGESSINVRRADYLNKSDTLQTVGGSRTFNLNDLNETDSDLILLYMYILPLFQGHGIKVGMTKCRMGECFWDSIEKRVREQDHELALDYSNYIKYGYLREVVYWGVCLDAQDESFKDHKIHDQILKKHIGITEKEQEWFCNIPLDDLIESFEEFRKQGFKDVFTPRKEQKECVNALINYFTNKKTSGRFLLNCKMRFGKSFTSYKYCEEANIDKILILTFVPAVETSWKEDLSHIEKNYKFYTDNHLKKNVIFDLIGEPYVLFLSLQNYLGRDKSLNEVKSKIKQLQDINWDLVILDEYHFGAWNERTQGTIEKYEDLEEAYLNELKKPKDIIERFKIKTKQTICLSGTPFKAIAKGEFTSENTFTYSYFDEQKNKYPNSEDGDFSTINSVYEHFPDMKIFGYNMSNLFYYMTSSVFSGDKLYGKNYFSLSKFFETRNDFNAKEPNVFIYEDEVKKWLEIIKGRSAFGDKFPYSNPEMLPNTRHTLWLMHSVNAVNAMSKILEEDNYFSRYQIINLSKDGVGAGKDAYDYLMKQITKANNTNKLGSIALTVNKLTLGVTVKEWSAVFVLKDLASPEQYFQSIFRVQTPFIQNGKVLKKYGFVYDFNIDRASALLLKYAEQSEEGSATKVQISRLIVKYLPIFINGDMSQPISESIFYELANFGDSHGIPLSRKIIDTSKTTRMLDEDTISCMLHDDEVIDIIKKVFAHAKFSSKSKTQTTTIKPDDGFQTKIAKNGRDLGYSLGLNDSSQYLDFDDANIQEKFEKKLETYVGENCPEECYDKKDSVLWINGFKKGYESGVNAPVKMLKCGEEDGVKFVNVVKNEFGENVTWNENTKSQIKDFINKYLNALENIPEKYRGAIYKRWYVDSFIKAVKKVLSVKDTYEGGNSVEDADNVLKHLLSRLFEFLYISVYRETTFQEIFNNADPDVFLEAVGITKKDFEVLNKYHVFQENVLNNYIHQFFVNESLGSSLNPNDEDNKKKYRNSLGWFGFNNV